MIPDAIVVLAHLMEKDGTLGVESRKRADKAAELSRLNNKCPIILMGWNYRDDTDLCISDAIASYLKSAHQIEDDCLLIDRESRDTVGDAILSKKKFLHLERFPIERNRSIDQNSLKRNNARAVSDPTGSDTALMHRKNIWIVTSDYHVERTRRIFEFVYGVIANIRVFGVQTESDEEKRSHEKDSLYAFLQTFAGIESGDDESIFEALIKRHPFYNGAIYPVLAAD